MESVASSTPCPPRLQQQMKYSLATGLQAGRREWAGLPGQWWPPGTSTQQPGGRGSHSFTHSSTHSFREDTGWGCCEPYMLQTTLHRLTQFIFLMGLGGIHFMSQLMHIRPREAKSLVQDLLARGAGTQAPAAWVAPDTVLPMARQHSLSRAGEAL